MSQKYPLEWYLERLVNVQRAGDGQYFARCPAHDDVMSSLHVKVTTDEDGEEIVLCHCFANCTYSEIMNALTNAEIPDEFQLDIQAVSLPISTLSPPTPTPQVVMPHSTLPVTLAGSVNDYAKVWWASYTGIPATWWEEQGVVFEGSNIYFSWDFTPSRKVRSPNFLDARSGQWNKSFRWEGGPKKFPLWPDFPTEMPETIYLSEGESDWGVYKFLGYPVWSVMQGSASKIDPEIFRSLADRGVKRVVLGFDDDQSGHKGADQLVEILKNCGLRAYVLPLVSIRDPLLFEKDIRDVWFRYLSTCGSQEKAKVALRAKVDEAVERLLATPASGGKVSLSQLFKMHTSESRWLIPGKWMEGSYGVFAGPPKIGKSIITLDLAISVATGTPFMGVFPVESGRGPVFLIGKEDSDLSLQTRAKEMINARGMFPREHEERDYGTNLVSHDLSFPSFDEIPLFFDLSKEFYLTDSHVRDLINWSLSSSREMGYAHPKLIVLDPLLRLSEGVDLFNASEVNQFVISPLKKIRDATGASVILVHHTKKESKDTPTFDSWYGSMALFASSESFMTIPSRKEDSEGFRQLIFGSKDSPVTSYKYRMLFGHETLACEVEEDTEMVKS